MRIVEKPGGSLHCDLRFRLFTCRIKPDAVTDWIGNDGEANCNRQPEF